MKTIIPRETPGDTKWFVKDRFGLFIHWGIYALPARHEWIKKYENIDTKTYEKYFKHFDPDLYDPDMWAGYAADAGMKYFVITTKHHDGFCLWDSKLTDYKATNTPASRDLIKPMVEAFRKHNMKTGFYHSLLDWHHPDYTVDACHPMTENKEYVEQDKNRNIQNYVDYLHGQVDELLTGYGKVDIIWFDFSVAPNKGFAGKGKEIWQSEKLIKRVRELQPGILINDRLQIDQDIKTPEQFMPREWVKINDTPVIWEGCHTLSGSWGYNRDEDSFKTVETLVKMLIDSVSKGGNFLLNVGPTGRGEFDERALSRLKGIGEWMKRHDRAIYNCTQAPEGFKAPDDCRYTYNPDTNRLYLHLFNWPFKHVHLDNMFKIVEYAQLLNDASEIKMTKFKHPQYSQGDDETLTLELPVKKPDVEVPVIELFLKEI